MGREGDESTRSSPGEPEPGGAMGRTMPGRGESPEGSPSSTNTPPEVSAIYVNYHCEELIERSILALRRDRARRSVEIVVVDNGSDRGAMEVVCARTGAQQVASPCNEGFGRACNAGVRASRGTHIVFLNPDTVPSASAIDELVDHLEGDPSVGAVGPCLVESDGSRQIFWCFHDLLSWELAEALYLQGPWRRQYERRMIRQFGWRTPWPVRFVAGACVAMPRAVFDAVGGFDPRFFLNFEDIDLCERVRQAGWRVEYLPWLPMVHEEGSVQRRDWSRFVFHRLEAHWVYLNKRHSGIALLAGKAIFAGAVLLRLAVGSVVLRGASRTRLAGYRRAWGLLTTAGKSDPRGVQAAATMRGDGESSEQHYS